MENPSSWCYMLLNNTNPEEKDEFYSYHALLQFNAIDLRRRHTVSRFMNNCNICGSLHNLTQNRPYPLAKVARMRAFGSTTAVYLCQACLTGIGSNSCISALDSFNTTVKSSRWSIAAMGKAISFLPKK